MPQVASPKALRVGHGFERRIRTRAPVSLTRRTASDHAGGSPARVRSAATLQFVFAVRVAFTSFTTPFRDARAELLAAQPAKYRRVRNKT